MSTLVVVGAQWGDEGKGKVVDVLAERADLVARFAGGNNAGHTLVVEGKQIITHLVPSGCTYPGTQCVLGAGMVIDPEVLEQEVASLRAMDLLRNDELRVSLDAHVVFPYHRQLDGLREDRAGDGRKIGTTRRGVGPAYEAKAARRGVRVRDLLDEQALRERLLKNKDALEPELERLGLATLDVDALVERGRGWGERLRPVVCDAGALCHDAITAGKRVLFEGAQGALLDVDHGTYPYVTSSNSVAGGVCTGIGIGPTAIDRVWGITKAYTTRVGRGPFPTRMTGADGDRLREAGAEFGATTGRPRDCGWLDLPALAHSARLSGMTGLCVTKIDVLAELPTVQICESYEDGVVPGVDSLEVAVPRLRTLEGWGDPSVVDGLRSATSRADLPGVVRAYLDLIEDQVGVSVALVSVGPDRSQTLRLADPF
ncbi:MAG: adenylosuccinate synthase [Deltaproteobacteria bacterium]|nr:adenylosuccinate synthase [Deltaproteobacteria bacterium]